MNVKMLSLEGVEAGYDGVQVLNGISFDVFEGVCLGLTGPNGHGKTTILNAVSGLVRPSRGSIELNGTSIVGLAPHKIAQQGVVFILQVDPGFTDLSVEENLLVAAYGGGLWSERDERLQEVYNLFPRLKERVKQRAGSLSGGEKRMLALGRGFVLKPKILLIDEPALGLAPRLVQEVFEKIRELHEIADVTMIIVEESPSRLSGIAEEIALIDKGQVIEKASTQEMLAHPQLVRTYLGTNACNGKEAHEG